MGGRAPCCDKRGAWSPAEDIALISFIQKNGHSNWPSLPKQAGLLRCGKSCRLRWINYLRPDVKRGNFTPEEENTIIKLHASLGNRWSKIASQLPGRTDNEIKNLWNTHLKKRSESGINITMKKNIVGNEEIKGEGEASSSWSSCCTGEQNSNVDHQQQHSSSLSAGTNQESQLSSSSCGAGDEMVVDASIDIWGMLDDLEQEEKLPAVTINEEELQLGGAVEWFKDLENELQLLAPTDDFPLWPNSPPHHCFDCKPKGP